MVLELRAEDFFVKGLPLAVEDRSPQPPFPRHCHQFSELVVITGGKGRHVIGDKAFPVSRGDVFVIVGKRQHHYDQMEDLCLRNVMFSWEEMGIQRSDLVGLPGYRALFELEPEFREQHKFASRLYVAEAGLWQIQESISELKAELEAEREGYRLKARAIFMKLVVDLSREYEQLSGEKSRHLFRISKAIDYIEEHFLEEVQINTLAQMVHVSPRQLQRHFKRFLGCTAIDYVNRLRLRKARKCLEDMGKNITDVAYECGYSDSNYFSRCFRAHTGVSPREFRKTIWKNSLDHSE